MSNTQLPAHLLALFNSNPELTGVGANIHNETHPKIRYSGKKWRLIPASGDEIVVKPVWVKDANGQPVGDSPINALDVIIVDINEHKSHVVFEGAYVEGEEQAPVWSSDDGTPVPVEHQTKTVNDYRRVAVIAADTSITGVYELRVSAGSITSFDRYNTAIKNNGVPIGALVTRITFDDAKDYPKLVFAPASYLNEAQAAALGKVSTENKQAIKLVIGHGPKSVRALAAPVAQAALPAPTVQAAPTVPVVVAEPKKTRTKKAETTPAQTVIAMPATPAPTTQAAAVVTKPQPTTSDLDALLSNIMGR